MADQLYLSLWFPNFRLESLPAALVSVMRQLAALSPNTAGKRVHAAAAYPIAFSEPPVYQRLYVTDERSEENQDTSASIIETAVAEATELLHDDVAYEFEMKWNLWLPDTPPDQALSPAAQLDTLWRLEPHTVRILSFGPEFDSSFFEQNGHIRVDFGLDFPWVLDDNPEADPEAGGESGRHCRRGRRRPALQSPRLLPPGVRTNQPHPDAAEYIRRNIETLLAFTLSVEKNCGISSRLLWTESGEPLAEKLIARLQRLN